MKTYTSADVITETYEMEQPFSIGALGIIGAVILVGVVIILAYIKVRRSGGPSPQIQPIPAVPEPAKKYCMQCGAEMPADAAKCPKCGEAVATT